VGRDEQGGHVTIMMMNIAVIFIIFSLFDVFIAPYNSSCSIRSSCSLDCFSTYSFHLRSTFLSNSSPFISSYLYLFNICIIVRKHYPLVCNVCSLQQNHSTWSGIGTTVGYIDELQISTVRLHYFPGAYIES